MKRKKFKTIILSLGFLSSMCFGTKIEAVEPDPSYTQTQVSIQLTRPVSPIENPEDTMNSITGDVVKKPSGFLPQTGNKQNLYLWLLGYGMVTLSSVIYFKRRTLKNE